MGNYTQGAAIEMLPRAHISPLARRESSGSADPINNVKDTVLTKCFSLANMALERSWTLHNATEALFWFRYILEADPQNATARVGAARVYQYVASQPWWHNDVSVAKSAAFKALALLEEPLKPNSLIESRDKTLICGQLYSAIGQSEAARRYLSEGIAIDPGHSSGHYFLYFNDLFIDPIAERVLPGLDEAVGLAETEGGLRRLAAALYFRGFANTLFANYHQAIKDLKRSMTINPGYGSANLALIAAAALARHKDTYMAVRCFKERYPKFDTDIIDYMWEDRSSCAEYQRLLRPLVEIIKIKLGSETPSL
jgi:tetratricopeptide (TPR) repeat protein